MDLPTPGDGLHGAPAFQALGGVVNHSVAAGKRAIWKPHALTLQATVIWFAVLLVLSLIAFWPSYFGRLRRRSMC